MTPDIQELIAELEEAERVVRPGAFTVHETELVYGSRCTIRRPDGSVICDTVIDRKDARLIALMRTHLPTLLSALSATEERAEAAEERVREATAYARDLAVAIVRKHYPENTAWEPLPDLMGILTQIDNATTGLVRAAPSPAPDEVERVARAISNNEWVAATQWHLENPGPEPLTEMRLEQARAAIAAMRPAPMDAATQDEADEEEARIVEELIGKGHSVLGAMAYARARKACTVITFDGLPDDDERPTALSEEERIEVTAERLRKAAQDWAREMVDKPPYWQALAAAIVPTNQEPRND